MQQACRYCKKLAVVPVVSIEDDESPLPGNKYRWFCTACERWLPMCSATDFRRHPRPHVRPAGCRMDERTVTPLDEFTDADDMFPEVMITDGGETPVDPLPEYESPPDQATEDPVLEQIQVLQEAVRMMVDTEIIDEAQGYILLSGKLADLMEAR